eukprot:3878320-Karenia_brevis.AAC.1
MMFMTIVLYIHVHLITSLILQGSRSLFAKAKSGKASDAHHMKAELVKAAPKESAALWLQLVSDILATRQEPASLKGGIAHALPKGEKGDGSDRPT